jgi:hypothetical protein
MEVEDWDEAEYVEHLVHARLLYAWVLCNYGAFSAEKARDAALAFYTYEAPHTKYRGLVFHDEAWHWAMLRLYGQGYWRGHPERWPPSREYRDASLAFSRGESHG